MVKIALLSACRSHLFIGNQQNSKVKGSLIGLVTVINGESYRSLSESRTSAKRFVIVRGQNYRVGFFPGVFLTGPSKAAILLLHDIRRENGTSRSIRCLLCERY